jgi:uncharacterized protein
MIPTDDQINALWDTYHLPPEKRTHVTLVAQVACFLAEQYQKYQKDVRINIPLIRASALLHDIDKNVHKNPGEQHPDAAVRILMEEGYEEVARMVKTHPLHAICDPAIMPSTIEEKLLFLADKMVKYEIITVDKRFELWKKEDVPSKVMSLLNGAYPKVKELEHEIFSIIGIDPNNIAHLAKIKKLSYNGF